MGGIYTGEDAAQFVALGCNTVQVCTGAMLQGYEMISKLEDGLAAFMGEKGFNSVTELVGASLPYFTTHADLVERQRAAKRAKAGQANRDEMWKGDIAKETDSLVTD